MLSLFYIHLTYAQAHFMYYFYDPSHSSLETIQVTDEPKDLQANMQNLVSLSYQCL